MFFFVNLRHITSKSREMRCIFIPIIIALLLIGCTRSAKEATEALTRAEAVMEETPDTALNILTRLDTAGLKTDRDRALYALLYTQARDKSYMDDTSAVLINRAVDYYRSNNDAHYTMLAHYYKGRIHENAQDYGEALYQLMRGYKLAEELNDSIWIGKTSQSIADIYMDTYNGIEAQKYAKINYNITQAKNPQNTPYSLYDLLRAYHNEEQYDSILPQIPYLLEIAETTQDTQLQNSVKMLWVSSLVGKNQTKKAINEITKLKDNDSVDTFIPFLISSYVREGLIDSATKLMPKIQDYISNQAIYAKYEYFNATKDYKQALLNLQISDSLSGSRINWLEEQNFNGILSKLIEEEDKTHKSEVKTERMWWALLIIVITIVLITITTLIIFIYRKRQNQLTTRLASMKEIATDYNRICEELKKAQNKVLKTRYELADSFFSSRYSEGDDEKARKKSLITLTEKLNAIGNDSETQIQMESWVNENGNDIITNFRQLPLSLKEVDYKVFLYSVLGFSHNTMATLIAAPDVISVYNRRKRMRNKLKALKNDYPDIDITPFLNHLS